MIWMEKTSTKSMCRLANVPISQFNAQNTINYLTINAKHNH